jgi:hypothetical protein
MFTRELRAWVWTARRIGHGETTPSPRAVWLHFD